MAKTITVLWSNYPLVKKIRNFKIKKKNLPQSSLFNNFPPALYFTRGSTYMSMLRSQLFPPSPFPRVLLVSVLYVYISIPALQEFLYHFSLNRLHKKCIKIRYLFFSFWLNFTLHNLEDETGRWEGGRGGRGYMLAYGWLTLLYSRNQHNVVKPLSSN